MKNKILIFIIGVLVGAIIATTGFYFYSKNNTSDENMTFERGKMQDRGDTSMSEDGDMPEMPDGEDGSMGDGEEPPEKPNE